MSVDDREPPPPPCERPLVLVRSSIDGIEWPGIPSPPGASLLALLFQFSQSERWDTARLWAQQLRQVRALLVHAVAAVPWYASNEVYGRALREDFDERALTALPILQRSEVQAAGTALHARTLPKGHGRRLPSRTTGSTGTPLDVVNTDLTNLFGCALSLRDHLWHGRDLSAKLAVIRGRVSESRLPGWQPGTSEALHTGPMVLYDIKNPIGRQIEWLQTENPGYVLTPASNARALARHCLGAGVKLPALRALRVYGEMPGADLGELARAAWDVPVQDVYSAEECGPLALQCPQQDGYHVQAENVLVEVLNADGRACAPGEVGRVVVSTLHNFAMPLIRYHLGDYAEVGAPCACGRGLPRLTRIVGRQRNMLLLPDGETRWPRLPGSVWRPHEVIRQLQVAQTARDGLEVRLRVSRELHADELARLVQALRDSLGWEHGLDVVYRGEAMHREGSKFEDFVNEMPTQEGAPSGANGA